MPSRPSVSKSLAATPACERIAIVLAVGHREFAAMRPAEIRRYAKRKHVVYDIKYLFDRGQADGRL